MLVDANATIHICVQLCCSWFRFCHAIDLVFPDIQVVILLVQPLCSCEHHLFGAKRKKTACVLMLPQQYANPTIHYIRSPYHSWIRPQPHLLHRHHPPACPQALPWLPRVVLQSNLHAFSLFVLACSDSGPSAVQNVWRLLSVSVSMRRLCDDGFSASYLCVGAVQYKNTTQYHHGLELSVTKWDHDERDLKLYNIPHGDTYWLHCDIPAEPHVNIMKEK